MKKYLTIKNGIIAGIVALVLIIAGTAYYIFADSEEECTEADKRYGIGDCPQDETITADEPEQDPGIVTPTDSEPASEPAYTGPQGYSFYESVAKKGVVVEFAHLFLEEGRAVAVVKITNNRKTNIEVYPDQNGHLVVDGKQLSPNMGDSVIQPTILPGATAEQYISFQLPPGISPESIKEVQVSVGHVWISDSDNVTGYVVKVKDLPSKKDDSIQLNESY